MEAYVQHWYHSIATSVELRCTHCDHEHACQQGCVTLPNAYRSMKCLQTSVFNATLLQSKFICNSLYHKDVALCHFVQFAVMESRLSKR